MDPPLPDSIEQSMASTSGSCAFLISKVFVYDWAESPQPVFQVLLIVISFVIAWGEAWFLDCRVIPQEQHARSYLSAISSTLDDRGPLLAPFLAASTGTGRHTESIANFYSPYESIHNSDDEGDKRHGRAFQRMKYLDWAVKTVVYSLFAYFLITRLDIIPLLVRLTNQNIAQNVN
uniref:MENTAL domain-containing protein n=1 Tax=Lutzomyia longipalpis TaxID=7200 RepID=A0A1B0CW85_LUTLO